MLLSPGRALHPQTSRLDCCWNRLTYCFILVFSSSSSFISRDSSKAPHVGHSPAQKSCLIPLCCRRGSQFLSPAFKAFCNMTHVCCSAYLTCLMLQPNETVPGHAPSSQQLFTFFWGRTTRFPFCPFLPVKILSDVQYSFQSLHLPGDQMWSLSLLHVPLCSLRYIQVVYAFMFPPTPWLTPSTERLTVSPRCLNFLSLDFLGLINLYWIELNMAVIWNTPD